MNWRYQKSARHFVGPEEQEERQNEGSEVINTIHLIDIGVRHNFSDRTSVSLSIPYIMAERSSPIRNASREVIGRSLTQARGLSDVTVMGRRWLMDPAQCANRNFFLGVGIKLPTGENNVTDVSRRFVDGQIVSEIRTVDQSIQPGDGGFGYVLEFQGFQRFAGGNGVIYSSASYLFNPEATNGVQTYRSRPTESEMSVADQYVASLGAGFALPWVEGLGVRLGGRVEGVPAKDLIGSSHGFRRPGYAVSIDPGVSYTRGDQSFHFSVPIAAYRNRVRSYSDRQVDGHGDAAFADYLIFFGYTKRF